MKVSNSKVIYALLMRTRIIWRTAIKGLCIFVTEKESSQILKSNQFRKVRRKDFSLIGKKLLKLAIMKSVFKRKFSVK
jgi:hypothetical protein